VLVSGARVVYYVDPKWYLGSLIGVVVLLVGIYCIRYIRWL
jgi:hypothetical protein